MSFKIADDRGKEHLVPGPPMRIVSLVPSETYSLFALGAGDRLVGRTRYCVAPAEAASIEEVGGTKDADIEKIVALAPDLVLANQEENTRRDIERLEAARIPVFVAFPKTVAAGVGHLARLARILGLAAEPHAKARVAEAYATLRRLEAMRRDLRPPVRTFVPIWMDPLMTANDDTYLADVLALAGAKNVFGERDRKYPLAADIGRARPLSPAEVAGRDLRYPRITLEELVASAPELVLLPDEPHPFTEADAAVFRGLPIPAAERGQVVFCDGKDLLWHGARGIEGLDRIAGLIDRARLPG